MSKVLVIPDLYLKTHILTKALEIVEREQVDECIFLGDYFDDWGCQYNAETYRDMIKVINNFRKKVPSKFILGNHDVAYLLEVQEVWSSRLPDVYDEVCGFLKSLNASIALEADLNTYSHRGILYDAPLFYTPNPSKSLLKVLYKSDLSPLWVRLDDLCNPKDTWTMPLVQIVGHTPMRKIRREDVGITTIYFTDVFLTYPTGNKEQIGKTSFLLVEDGMPEVIKDV